MDRLVQFLMLPFVIGVAIIWVFVGLVFAAPLIAKAILIFTLDLLVSAISQQRHTRAAEGLKQALTFYPRGFALIFGSLSSVSQPPDAEGAPYEFARGRWGPIVDSGKMIVLAVVFWGTTTLFFHHLGVVRIERIAEAERGVMDLVSFRPRPVAAAAPEPTPTRFDCRVNTPRSNLREAARRGSPSITRLPEGAEVALIEDPFAGDDWIRIATREGQRGYIHRDLITCSSPPR
ncbi:MAG: SH3 domain-containing protein [Hyphomonadaceae bacterium]